MRLALLILLAAMLSPAAHAGARTFNGDVNTCVTIAANEYSINRDLLYSVMMKESGGRGGYHVNKNGTVDYGPMQVNSRWLKSLAPYGITPWHLAYDTCTSIRVGAWRLKSEIVAARGDVWRGVGNYHSTTRDKHENYKNKVAKIYSQVVMASNFTTRGSN